MANHIYKKIHYQFLTLDVENPRLPKSFHRQSEEMIIEYMLLEAATLELMQAIGENDFFAGEQLLVVKEDSNNYRVIEGNRRLIAIKLLQQPNLATVQKSKVQKVYEEAKYHPTEIPCLIFNQKEEILRYLGYRHITGVKSWKLLEKARYLYRLKLVEFPDKPFKEACRELAKMIGSRRDYVQRIIAGYDLFLKIEDLAFYNIPRLNDTTFHFNYIADSLNHSKIAGFLGVDLQKDTPLENLKTENLKKWTHWLFEKNQENRPRLIGDSRHLNMLNKIIGNPQAFKAFDEDGLNIYRAYELTDDINDIFSNAIKKSLTYLEQANGLVHKINEMNPSSIDNLKSIGKLARNIIIIKERTDDEF